MTRPIVIMGPAGNGKSTLGRALANALALPFIEGDDCHPPENVAKMARGEALTDADRAPFLDAVGTSLAAHPHGATAACSALKRDYRDRLNRLAGDVLYILPQVPREELHRRLTARANHFMPPSQVDSQLATLELPDANEAAILLDGLQPTERQLAILLGHLAPTTP